MLSCTCMHVYAKSMVSLPNVESPWILQMSLFQNHHFFEFMYCETTACGESQETDNFCHPIPSKEACTIFDGGVSKFEVAAVCHEAPSFCDHPDL